MPHIENGKIAIEKNRNKILQQRVEVLEAFFKEVARLTIHHHTDADHAWVAPSDLGAALEKVNPEWWKVNDKF